MIVFLVHELHLVEHMNEYHTLDQSSFSAFPHISSVFFLSVTSEHSETLLYVFITEPTSSLL